VAELKRTRGRAGILGVDTDPLRLAGHRRPRRSGWPRRRGRTSEDGTLTLDYRLGLRGLERHKRKAPPDWSTLYRIRALNYEGSVNDWVARRHLQGKVWRLGVGY
jgi:hypothetical protein